MTCLSFSCVANVHLSVWYGSPDLTVALETLTKQFEQQNPTITISTIQIPNEELKTSVVKAVRKGNAPDIVILPSDNMGLASVMKLSLLDVTAATEGLSLDAAEGLLFDGDAFGMPLYQHNRLMMFYNKTLVAQPARNWLELEKQHQQFASQGIQTLGVNTREPYWFAHFVTQFNAQMLSSDKLNLASPDIESALHFYRRLIELGVIRENCTYDCVSVEFYKGKVAYAMDGNWSLKQAVETMGDQLGIATFPSLRGRQAKTLTSLTVMVYPNKSLSGERSLEITALSNYLRLPSSQKQMFTLSYLMPYHQSVLDELSEQQWMASQLAVRGENVYVPPSMTVVSMWNGMQKGLGLFLDEKLDSAATTRYMQKVYLRDLGNLRSTAAKMEVDQ